MSCINKKTSVRIDTIYIEITADSLKLSLL